MAFCLLPDKVAEFRQALKNKEINVSDLLDMTTEERTKLLEQYAGPNAKDVNTLFEEKLVLKNRIQGIKNWAMKAGELGKYSAMGKEELAKTLSEYKAAQQERIFSPKENEAFLNDLADKRLGVHISKDVAQKVFELSAKAEALKNENPKLSGVSDEYLNARHELNKYVDSQKPLSVPRSILKNLATIARNNLLLNPATPIKTTVGQIVNSTMDFFTRRIGSTSFKGANSDLVKQANAEAWDTFKKTGVNTASMGSLDDMGKLGEGKNFDTPSGAVDSNKVVKGVEVTVRKAAQISNKVAIDWEHNYTFTKFYQKAFFDMTNVFSTNIAKSEGLKGEALKARAAEIFKDAVKIDPETDVGAMARLEAQKNAARVTSTNSTLMANISLGVKNALNKAVPGLGDALMPIAKIPANIIWNGIENAGLGIPLGIKDIYEGRAKISSEDVATRYEGMAQYAAGIQKLSRTIGSIGVAALIASQLSKKDFKSDQYGNHFVKIGNTWVNQEYIAAISPALAGFMTIKANEKPGQGAVASGGQYVAGSLSGLKGAPGVDEVNGLITSITNTNYAKGIKKYASDFFTSRGIPAFVQNLQKDRPANRLLFGAHGVESIQQVKADTAATVKTRAQAKKKK